MTQTNADNPSPSTEGSQAAPLSLTPIEARVLGVLVEKEKTTPDLYPLTINAAMNGANQKNNRHPVTEFDEDDIREAINSLRHKGLVVQSDSPGSRASKYRHTAAEKLGLSVRELVILAELLLRGPQTLGELRGRASRMHAMESLDMVRATLEQLQNKQPPLVRELRPAAGSRAERYAQLLAPEELEESVEAVSTAAPTAGGETGEAGGLAERVAQLEAEVASMRDVVRRLALGLGNDDPFANDASRR